MTVQIHDKYRTRKNPLNGTTDVQAQNLPGYPWRSIGRVRERHGDPELERLIANTSLSEMFGVWQASHYGRVLGYFATKREAVAAVLEADSQ